eukprot:8176243-Pyramimonas_sp.AAC.1
MGVPNWGGGNIRMRLPCHYGLNWRWRWGPDACGGCAEMGGRTARSTLPLRPSVELPAGPPGNA